MKFATPAALVLAIMIALPSLAEPPSRREAAENLRQISRAMQLYAEAATQPLPRAGGPVTRPAEVEALLEQRLAEVKLEDAGIKDALAFLSQVGGVSIDVNWKALKDVEAGPADRVNLNARNIRLDRALSLVVSQLGNGKVCFDVDDTVVRISTESDLAGLAEVRVYDVRDLIDTFVAAHQGEPIHWGLGVPATAPAENGGIGGSGSGEWTQQTSYAMAVTQLSRTITDLIARDVWVENGGQVASIHEFAGKLVVRQTPRNHRQIVELLTKLRETK